MNSINNINNIKLNSSQIISAITEYIIVSCLDLNDKNFKMVQDDLGYWLELVQTLNNKIRELTKVDEYDISNLEIIKIITSCISFYYPNLNQMMNRIMEEYN